MLQLVILAIASGIMGNSEVMGYYGLLTTRPEVGFCEITMASMILGPLVFKKSPQIPSC